MDIATFIAPSSTAAVIVGRSRKRKRSRNASGKKPRRSSWVWPRCANVNAPNVNAIAAMIAASVRSVSQRVSE